MNQYNNGKFNKKTASPDRAKGSKVTTQHQSHYEEDVDKKEEAPFKLIETLMERPQVETSDEREKERTPFDVMMGIGKILKKTKVETKKEEEVEMKKVDVSVISPEIFSPQMSDVDESMEVLSNMKSVIGSQILDSVIETK